MSTRRPLCACVVAGTVGLTGARVAQAQVHVSPWIGDHMVVQRGRPVELSGTDVPGASIRATIGGGAAATRADGAGRWRLALPAVAAGGPYVLSVQGSNQVTFGDVWSGEVWVASGQSNMEFPLMRARGGPDASADGCPGLWLLLVAQETSESPQTEWKGSWQTCEPAAVEGFSAVAFYFARAIHRALGVPVGIIQSAWGGTPAEAWTPRDALMADPTLKPMVESADLANRDPVRRAELERKLADWETKNFHQDTGNRGEALGFASPGAGARGWSSMDLPQVWENAGLKIDGAVWFRREVELPAEWTGRDLALSLGAIDDFDVTYWNGERIGATGAETPQYWTVPRHYIVAGRLAKAGTNVVAVRVFDHYGSGGFAGTRAQMTLAAAVPGTKRISLAGPWSYKVERRLEPAVADFTSRPVMVGPREPTSPSVLWNAMVAPIAGLPVAGVIWYQGESNVGRAEQYRSLFPTMIQAWRAAWHDPALPFLFVQLPNYDEVPAAHRALGESAWAELREAQAAALREPRTAMAVTLDVGEANNIHPLNKEEVGRRLSQWALRVVYGKDVIASGPVFLSAVIEGSAMRVRFDAASAGLDTADGESPKGFIVAGGDRLFHAADARIEGDTVVVSSPNVPRPLVVRYGWADSPPNTLRNLAGLPAAPFRTDTP